MITGDKMTVVIRPSDITLGEARRRLAELGVDEDEVTLENFRYDTSETDSGLG